MNKTFRKLKTRNGIYFVAWRPDDVIQLFISEKLVPADLLCNEPHETHCLIRDLFLLALADTLKARNNQQISTSVLTQYARKLHSSLLYKSPGFLNEKPRRARYG